MNDRGFVGALGRVKFGRGVPFRVTVRRSACSGASGVRARVRLTSDNCKRKRVLMGPLRLTDVCASFLGRKGVVGPCLGCGRRTSNRA